MNMEKAEKMRNQLASEKLIKALESRNMEAYYVVTKEEACAKALELIPAGSSVSWGGAKSAHDIGLMQALYEKGTYEIMDREKTKSPEEARKITLQAFDCDYYLGGVNAMTEDGILVNVDGSSNRVAAYSYGPGHLILIVSMNKVMKTLDAAMERARTVASPINAQRFGLETPCSKTGICADCKHPQCICCNILITRYSRVPQRIKVILLHETVGF
ncbi:MAG: lactate utilization protein [Lachnospiraceae bacterium]|nr:lactate utilization protein [Lachnospiraceae bacterium]